MWQRVSELCVELVDKTFDQPVAVDRIIYDLLHGSADGEKVLVFFILEKTQHQKSQHQRMKEAKRSSTCKGQRQVSITILTKLKKSKTSNSY